MMTPHTHPSEMPPPILITGAARSGTSMVAGIIHMCGAFGGKMRGPNQFNAKGMFENARIVNSIIKPYLQKYRWDPLGQYPLPDINKLNIPMDLKSRVEYVMRDEGYTGGPWFYKGAKMCLIWPIWAHAFPNAKWIIVRRRTGDIVESCTKTTFMRAFRNENVRKAVGAENEWGGWVWWVRQHEKRFVEMIEAGINIKYVWPDRMVRGDYRQIYDTVEWLGLKWTSEVLAEVTSFIDPRLWKSRHKGKDYPCEIAIGGSKGV